MGDLESYDRDFLPRFIDGLAHFTTETLTQMLRSGPHQNRRPFSLPGDSVTTGPSR